ncbi:M35 family metallo-endopeptidase [Peredibacter starrii]|uniref:M35 family metallo-endopeptidase n=1 Tax=Peredibacter starrii TaxID=28202 RepID=A0AAX4HJJ1_9BACT|nr:M35 family metallo-endopeptidase [Peredibacter starrii]WPU63397.1 M35 family metallo-endopeptidase [Peredibacter starrii]
MGKCLLPTLFLILSITAFADEFYEFKKGDPIEHVLQVLQDPIEPVVYCTEEFEKFKVSNCDAEKSAIIFNLFDENYKLIFKVDSQIQRYRDVPEVKSDPKRMKDLNKISDTLRCMKDKMSNAQVTCQTNRSLGCLDKKRVAYVMNLPQFMRKNLNLCPRYWKEEDAHERAGVMFHEISHFCGTIDHQYYWKLNDAPNEKKLVKNSTRLTRPNGEPIYPDHLKPPAYYHEDIACTNADSYRYWADNGFCLPGYDCAKR